MLSATTVGGRRRRRGTASLHHTLPSCFNVRCSCHVYVHRDWDVIFVFRRRLLLTYQFPCSTPTPMPRPGRAPARHCHTHYHALAPAPLGGRQQQDSDSEDAEAVAELLLPPVWPPGGGGPVGRGGAGCMPPHGPRETGPGSWTTSAQVHGRGGLPGEPSGGGLHDTQEKVSNTHFI